MTEHDERPLPDPLTLAELRHITRPSVPTVEEIAAGRRTVARAWLDRHGLADDVDDLLAREDVAGTAVATAEALAGQLPPGRRTLARRWLAERDLPDDVDELLAREDAVGVDVARQEALARRAGTEIDETSPEPGTVQVFDRGATAEQWPRTRTREGKFEEPSPAGFVPDRHQLNTTPSDRRRAGTGRLLPLDHPSRTGLEDTSSSGAPDTNGGLP